MVGWNRDLLHNYLAPEMGEFIHAEIPDLIGKHPEAPHWIANHFLNSILRGSYRPEVKPLAVTYLFRVQTAFKYFHEARALTLQFVGRAKPESPSTSLYFSAVAAWEAAVLNAQWAQEIIAKTTATQMFKTGDASDDERLWKIANIIKHCGSHMAQGLHGQDLTIPMWLANRGLITREAELSFEEMATHIDALAAFANTLQDPLLAADKHAAANQQPCEGADKSQGAK